MPITLKIGLYWIFEYPVFMYNEKDRPRVWAPDFYIPLLGIYVEVCGSERFDYQYRENIYKKNGYSVIFIHFYKEKEKWKTYLVRKMREIEENRHAEAMKRIGSWHC
ncbi:hypothetical protein HXY32_04675 [Candidatus Bathyarchaeota archaeon]|nr:hypothetical protein [Candidatus Bathyarchaeota archaeon]